MTTPAQGGGNELKSHELKDITESLTGNGSQTDLSDTASSTTLPHTTDYAGVPLKGTAQEPASEEVQAEPQQQNSGGGVTGFIRSWIGGNNNNKEPATHEHEAVKEGQNPEVTHETELKGGTHVEVAKAPGHSAVPDTLRESPTPVGVAKTSFTEPVSEFAPALTSIAGEPEASDPTKKFGHALDPLTGDEPVASPSAASGGIISTVTHAATNVIHTTVDTVKHVAGYDHPQETGSATPQTGTGLVDTSSPGIMTAEDLPKVGRINPNEDGSIEVGEGQATSLAARQAAPAAPATGGALTPHDLPKSGTVDAAGDGSSEINAAQRPGLIAAAVGTIAGGAEYVKDSVAGIIGGDQAGDTSEQIAALDRKNGDAIPEVPAQVDSKDKGTIPEPSTTNQAGPIITEGSQAPASDKKPVVYEDHVEPQSKGVAAPASGPGYESADASSAAPASAVKTPETASKDTSSAAVPANTPAPSGPSSAAGIASPAGAAAGAAGLDSTAKTSKPIDKEVGSDIAAAEGTGVIPKEKEAVAPSEKEAGSLVKEVKPDPSNGQVESSKAGKGTIRLPTGDVIEVAKPASATEATSAKSPAESSSKPVLSAFASPNNPGTGAKTPEASTNKAADVSFSNPDGSSAAPQGAPVPAGTTKDSAVNISNTPASGKATSAVDNATAGTDKTAATGDAAKTASTAQATGTGAKPATEVETAPKASFAGQAKDHALEKKKEKGSTCGCCVIS